MLGLALSACLWWTYFGGDDALAEYALAAAPRERRGRMSIEAFGHADLGLLLGVIAIAAGLEAGAHEPFHALDFGHAVALGGGVALYLVSDAWFRQRLRIGRPWPRVLAAIPAFATVAVGLWVAAQRRSRRWWPCSRSCLRWNRGGPPTRLSGAGTARHAARCPVASEILVRFERTVKCEESTMVLALTLLSGIAWTVVYVFAIRIGFQQRTYAIPAAALALNIAWETIYASRGLATADFWSSLREPWAVADLLIVYTYLRYGRRELPDFVSRRMFVGWNILIFTTAYVVQWLFVIQFGWAEAPKYAAFLQNLLMSILFIAMFVARRGSRGQGIVLAVAKWIGTLAPTIAFGALAGSMSSLASASCPACRYPERDRHHLRHPAAAAGQRAPCRFRSVLYRPAPANCRAGSA